VKEKKMPIERKNTGKKKKADGPVYQLRVILKGIRPPIWRRIQVPGDTSLWKLHKAIQILMGWEDYHLHSFTIGGFRYGIPDPGGIWDTDEKDDRRFKLAEVAPAVKSKIRYMYDFGDDWDMEILVEKLLPPEEGIKYPVCLAGKRAGPPEDCGGVWGYQNLLEIIKAPDHSEYGSMMEWLGDEFDPEAFDLDAVNAKVVKIKR
jgi:hypothetical protein